MIGTVIPLYFFCLRKFYMMEISGTIKDILEMTVKMRSLNKKPDYYYAGIEDFVLQNGQAFEYQPLPDKYERGVPRECYSNALKLAMQHPELRYVEGFGNRILLGVQHAWCIDPDGKVVDNTWNEHSAFTMDYYGVIFPLDIVLHVVNDKGTTGVLEEWTYVYKYMIKHKWDPENFITNYDRSRSQTNSVSPNNKVSRRSKDSKRVC